MELSNSDFCIQKISLKVFWICYVHNFVGKKNCNFFRFFWKITIFSKKNLHFSYSEKKILFWKFLFVPSENKFYKLSNGIFKKAQRLLLILLTAKNVGWIAIQKVQRRHKIQKNYNFKTSFPLNGLYIGELNPLIYFVLPNWFWIRSEYLRFLTSGDLCPLDVPWSGKQVFGANLPQ